jgi:uncharacterized repeat protein (TIGR03803 family)
LVALFCGAVLTACAHPYGTSLIPADGRNVASAGSYKSLYSFGQFGKADDGRRPSADLIAVGSEFFGTTEYGGTTDYACYVGCGTVFEVSAAGKERVVYRFTGGNDGAAPAGGLIDVNGVLFGTTTSGGTGAACSGGCGTIFELSTDGKSENVIYSFQGGTDGAGPVAGLVSFNGSLYGTTASGGQTTALCSTGCGTIFSVRTKGPESVVYAFKGGTDGAQPIARLIALDGALYGTTQYGGKTTALCATGCGTLFRFDAGGAKKILYSFKYTNTFGDGAYPVAGPTAVGAELYGTTMGGGKMGDGTVFKVNPSSGAETVLHSFSCCTTSTDGQYPFAHLTRVSNALYGITRDGGTTNKGVVFKISVSGSESILHDFSRKPDGAQPQASLLFHGGVLYGTTTAGGSRGEGSVFALIL